MDSLFDLRGFVCVIENRLLVQRVGVLFVLGLCIFRTTPNNYRVNGLDRDPYLSLLIVMSYYHGLQLLRYFGPVIYTIRSGGYECVQLHRAGLFMYIRHSRYRYVIIYGGRLCTIFVLACGLYRAILHLDAVPIYCLATRLFCLGAIVLRTLYRALYPSSNVLVSRLSLRSSMLCPTVAIFVRAQVVLCVVNGRFPLRLA